MDLALLALGQLPTCSTMVLGWQTRCCAVFPDCSVFAEVVSWLQMKYNIDLTDQCNGLLSYLCVFKMAVSYFFNASINIQTSAFMSILTHDAAIHCTVCLLISQKLLS